MTEATAEKQPSRAGKTSSEPESKTETGLASVATHTAQIPIPVYVELLRVGAGQSVLIVEPHKRFAIISANAAIPARKTTSLLAGPADSGNRVRSSNHRG